MVSSISLRCPNACKLLSQPTQAKLSVEPIKIQADHYKLLPKFPQHPQKPEFIQGLSPIVEDLISKDL